MLLGTGWLMLGGGVRFEQASDELAGVTFGLGTLLVILGALHHRGLTAGGGGVTASVPPEPSGDVTKRLASREKLPTADELGDDETDEATSYWLGEDILERYVLAPDDPIADCRGQVWQYDSESGVLYGMLQPGHPGVVTFVPGEGAVGLCWERQEYVIAEGDDVVSADFGLDATKAARYADVTAVAAVPITSASGRMIGVLSMSSRDPATRLASDDALQHMIFLAEIAARVLVDLFKWFNDGTVEETEGGS